MNGPDRALELFLQAFSASDIAETLPSFDHDADAQAVRSFMQERKMDLIGVRRLGLTAGWSTYADLSESDDRILCRAFDDATVISPSCTFDDILKRLDKAPFLFVRSFGQVNGVIRRVDVQKPPVRMWLFGLVTITESRVTRLIDEFCPEERWLSYLSPGRVQKARDLQSERLRRNQRRTLLECLQIADKGRIIAKDPALRERSRFSTNREAESFVRAFEDLRNNLAHSQDLLDDWDVILTLATDLERFVVGTSRTGAAGPSS